MKSPNLLLWTALVVCLAGCDQNQSNNGNSPAGPTSASAAPDAIRPVRQTSFAEVTSQLDPGGSVYGYLATDQWLAGLTTNVANLRDFFLEIPDIQSKDRENIRKVADMIAKVIDDCGVEDLTGIGVSGIQITPELHRTKLVLHHKPGAGGGLLWTVGGKQPHALTGLEFLSTNTALAGFGDLDLAAVWKMIENDLGKSGFPELSDGIRKWPAEFEKNTKLSWSKLLDSLGGEVGLILTLDEANRIGLPIGDDGIEIPAPGLMVVIKVNDDLLFDRLSTEMKKNTAVEITEEKGLKMYAMPIPVPLPTEIKITVASTGDYLMIASSPRMVREALAVRSGTTPGLKQSGEAQSVMKYLPAEGNQFTYVSKRFSGTIMQVQQQIMSATGKGSPKQVELIRRLLGSKGPDFGMSVGAHTSTGWNTVSVGSQDSATALVAAPTVAVTAVGAAMVLPALAKAKTRAQSIACMNNMKQIALAAHLWASDHNDQFCWNVSTNAGGTLELCEPAGDGYDHNAAQHFQAMAKELNTTKILVCPGDKSKQPATDFESLGAWNVSYEVRTGAKVSSANPEEIMIYCPIHHHTGRTDGSVRKGNN